MHTFIGFIIVIWHLWVLDTCDSKPNKRKINKNVKIIKTRKAAKISKNAALKKPKINKSKHHRAKQHQPKYYKPHQNFSAMVVHYQTGDILHGENIYKKVYPASLTKMLTAYLYYIYLDQKKIKMDNIMTAHQAALNVQRVRLGMRPGEKLTVRQAIEFLMVCSCNDVAEVMAKSLFDNRGVFIDSMNIVAGNLGMKNSQFGNPSGLPHQSQYSTAFDLMLLSLHLLKHFPDYHNIYKKTDLLWHGQKRKSTSNLIGQRLIGRHIVTFDGLKTGYLQKAGYNMSVTCRIGSGLNSHSINSHKYVIIVTGAYTGIHRRQLVLDLVSRVVIPHYEYIANKANWNQAKSPQTKLLTPKLLGRMQQKKYDQMLPLYARLLP